MKERQIEKAEPLPLSEFPGVPFEYIEVLRSRKINTAREFLLACRIPLQKMELSKDTGIPEARLTEMAALAGLSEIPGIGPLTARILYEAGAKSLEQLGEADTGALLEQCRKIILERRYNQEPPSKQEISRWIAAAKRFWE